ncbi:hypothetical protein [Blastococcus deserti]|uniref:Uncharacterized protein n=1 Tax=Blastococcus deserti TaxID=2259033 RepID=A0ABW4X940_9ACTN
MAEPPVDPNPTREGTPRTGGPGVPGWVKVLGVVVLLVVLLVVVLHVTGNSLGGPGGHLGSAASRLAGVTGAAAGTGPLAW